MDDVRGAAAANDQVTYRGLRDWIEKVDGLGELLRVDGADWDAEMGTITHMLTEKSRGNAPAILFDNIPGYPKGYRTLYGSLSSIRRVAMTLGLPIIRTSPDHGTAFNIVGKNKASEGSMKAAIELAAKLASKKIAAKLPTPAPLKP